MVLAQVREDEAREAHAIEATQLRRMRGRLHRAAPVARVEHLAEGALEVDCLRRRAHHRPALAADAALDRSEEPGPAAGGREDRVEKERCRRLAVRAGDARDLELPRRLVEERVRGDGHRGSRVVDDELRDGELERPLDDERDGAPSDGVGGEVVAVRTRPGDAEEERAGLDTPGGVREVADLGGCAGDHGARRERRDDALQLHRVASLATASHGARFLAHARV